MADQSELRMNLAAIKRVDPYAKDIVDSSAHVAFYTFNSEETEWEKTDVEGAFFIYSRNAEPYHSIFINNRLNTNSLVEPITLHIELQSQPPFLLYRNERNRIRGFWFYNKAECDRIGELVDTLVKDCDRKQTLVKQQLQQQQMDNMSRATGINVDIFSMLSKAQEDFNNSYVPSGTITQPQVSMSRDNQVQLTKASTDVGTSQSVMNFFAAAKPATAKEVPFFQRMLSNPVHVDQIEKQQRAVSPPQQDAAAPLLQGNNLNVENGFMRVQSPNYELGTSPLATFLQSSNLSLQRNPITAVTSATNTTDVAEIESRQQPQQPLHQLLKKSELNCTTPNKPALMLPTMFKTSSTISSTANTPSGGNLPMSTGIQSKPIHIDNSILQPDVQLTNKTNNNINHNAVANIINNNNNNNNNYNSNSKKSSDISNIAPEPLTQSQLLQAMTYLIKNDPEFVRKLHEAYLKSFTEMVSL